MKIRELLEYGKSNLIKKEINLQIQKMNYNLKNLYARFINSDKKKGEHYE